MSPNGPVTILRTANDEADDVQAFQDNIYNESWKSWPNEAAVRIYLTTFFFLLLLLGVWGSFVFYSAFIFLSPKSCSLTTSNL